MDKTLTPSPWTNQMDYPKTDYPKKMLFWMCTIERAAIYILKLHIPCLFSYTFDWLYIFVFRGCSLRMIIIQCIFSFLFIDREPTTWPANSCLQISVLLQIIFCSCVIETTLLCENGRSVPRAVRVWFDIFSWSKEQWSNDKTIIELSYCKISWFVSVSQINNYLPQPSALANNNN